MGKLQPSLKLKLGASKISISALRLAIEKQTGTPYQEVLANVFIKLYNDFLQDINVREFLVFQAEISRRLVQDEEVTNDKLNPVEKMSESELNSRLIALIKEPQLKLQDWMLEQKQQLIEVESKEIKND